MWLRSVTGHLAGDHITEVVELRNISEGGLAVHSSTPQKLGELVMHKLEALDKVAYIRFASVYKRFKSVDEFIREIEKLK